MLSCGVLSKKDKTNGFLFVTSANCEGGSFSL